MTRERRSNSFRLPGRRPVSSDAGRSRIGDITRPISISRGIADDQRINTSRRGTLLLGLLAVGVAAAMAAGLFGFPIRTYLDQDDRLAERTEQLEQLESVTGDLKTEVDRLRTDAGTIEAARTELGYVAEGEQRATIVDSGLVPTQLPVGWPYDLATNVVNLRRAGG